MAISLFVLGMTVGSFLNVLRVRYDPEKFILTKITIGGRSVCPKCGSVLRWFELVPVISFVLQAGRCRHCGKKISPLYPIVEIVTGLIFVFVPRVLLSSPYALSPKFYALSLIWISVFVVLFLLALIDARTRIIPDETVVVLLALGIVITVLSKSGFGFVEGSFLGHYALLFGGRGHIWVNRALAAFLGLAFFAFVIAVTRGRAMGMGDAKLALALGVLFGWPDTLLIVALAFVFGAVFGLGAIAFRKTTIKGTVPFGPFLALASLVVFFFGFEIVDFYFKLFGI
jgi:leader peptidase (prepilin peptidase)/N-methyltransferase